MPAPSPKAWVFDLDNTLYPAESTLYDAIGERMTAYIARATGLAPKEAETLREHYFHEYGATVVGLIRHHGVDGAHFMADVHDVDLSIVAPDPALNALIAALDGRKFVFTNGGRDYARRILAQLDLASHFDAVIDLETLGFTPKPHPDAYAQTIALCGIDPRESVLIEDTLHNLIPAAALGFETVLVGAVHPDPRPPYVHHHAHDLKSFLRGGA
ncbi:MAG: pyrimidine 5'-nucleotidase [Pseudomonadota bacterium]